MGERSTSTSPKSDPSVLVAGAAVTEAGAEVETVAEEKAEAADAGTDKPILVHLEPKEVIEAVVTAAYVKAQKEGYPVPDDHTFSFMQEPKLTKDGFTWSVMLIPRMGKDA